MNYTIFEKSTGRILRTVQCAECDVSLQYDPEIADHLEGAFADNLHYVSGGEAVSFPAKPTPFCTWDYSASAWVDARTLDQVKSEQWEKIKVARDAALTAPLLTQYGTFDADVNSQRSITDAIMLLQTLEASGNPTTIDFTLADNTTVSLSTAQMVEVGLQLGQRTQSVFASGRAYRAAIEAASSISEAEAIHWS